LKLFAKVKVVEPVPLDQAFERYYTAIFRYFRYRGADVATANDLTSSTFERALKGINHYDTRKSQIQTWLFAIARNVSINHWKSESIRATAPLDDELPDLDDPPLEDALIFMEDKEQILLTLQSLDSRAREIIALKFGGPLNNRQIADLTGLSEQNVAVILYRSLLKLRNLLTTNEEMRHDNR
jgi:RNA polymerase sigma factor (sigma-70 family)